MLGGMHEREGATNDQTHILCHGSDEMTLCEQNAQPTSTSHHQFHIKNRPALRPIRRPTSNKLDNIELSLSGSPSPCPCSSSSVDPPISNVKLKRVPLLLWHLDFFSSTHPPSHFACQAPHQLFCQISSAPSEPHSLPFAPLLLACAFSVTETPTTRTKPSPASPGF